MSTEFKSLKDQVVIITGSGQGIGKEIAIELANVGAKVVITDVNKETAQNTAEEIVQSGGQAMAVVCDVTNSESVHAMFDEVMAKYETVDILINNAGITMDGLFIRMKEEAWRKVIEVNLTGMFLCSQVASNIMRKARKGNIICISSIAAGGNPGQANYSASKAGVIGLSNTLAKELAPFKIRVNSIAPGFVNTPMTQKMADKHKDRIISAIPLGRAGEPEDIANLVLFLASDLSAYITGQVIHVNGGITGL